MVNHILPPYLKPGDFITILSTARKIDGPKLDIAIQMIESWGYQVKLSQNLRAEHHQFCGTDGQRAKDLQEAINDPECKAIICFRGGYGSIRILDKVDFTPLLKNPKWICGYSDVTAVHNVLRNIGIASLHSTMPINFPDNTEESIESFKNHLIGNSVLINSEAHPFNHHGLAEGVLTGGNLSMLYSLSGTKHDIDTKDCILFIEDLDEYLYHVDRMMWNLSLGNKLSHIKGLIIGGMSDMNDNTIPFGKNAEQIILEHSEKLNIPIAFNFPAGHIDDNRTLAFGKKCIWEVNASGAKLEA